MRKFVEKHAGSVLGASAVVALLLVVMLLVGMVTGSITSQWAAPSLLLFGSIIGAIWSTWLSSLMEARRENVAEQTRLREIACQVYWELRAGVNLAVHYSSNNLTQLPRLPTSACEGVLRSGVPIPREVGENIIRYLEKVAVINSEVEIFLSGVTTTGPTVNEAEVKRVKMGVLNQLGSLSKTQLLPQANLTVAALKSAALIPQDYKEDFETENEKGEVKGGSPL